jgi:hypothetical protein
LYSPLSSLDSVPLPAVFYQLDLVTPGNKPSDAIFRKQIRHKPNFRKKALGRPQTGQRLYARTWNLGLRFAFAIKDFLATFSS